MKEKSTFTCTNSACKKVFANPLKTLNLQQDPAEPYYACPFCLTKVAEIPDLKKESTNKDSVEGQKTTPSGCTHYLGYLSERAQTEKISDECMVCKEIVDCMLKKMRV
jgi:hypothetical protein